MGGNPETIPVRAAALTPSSVEYGQMTLSQDNLIVDTHALIKAYTSSGEYVGLSLCPGGECKGELVSAVEPLELGMK